jgi:hypothetical protein
LTEQTLISILSGEQDRINFLENKIADISYIRTSIGRRMIADFWNKEIIGKITICNTRS